MQNLIKIGDLHDGSEAKTILELIKYWRMDADLFWESPYPVNNQTISRMLRSCADDLERVNNLTTPK